MNNKIKLKMALKIWVVIYPSITAFLFFFGEFLAPLPLYLRTLILTLCLVPWIIFIGVPGLDKLIKKLFQTSK